jgi:hypothetical protein
MTNEKEKRKISASPFMPTWAVAVSVIALCMLSGLILYGAYLANDYLRCLGTISPTYADVERSAVFSFPSSAQMIEYTVDGEANTAFRHDCIIWISFKMKAPELESFQTSTLVASLDPSMLVDIDFNKDLRKSGWKFPLYALIGSADTFETGTGMRQWVIVDNSQPDIYTVYITVMKY